MKLVSIAGIQRATVYSPNHVGNDAAIFSATARWLEKAGYQVNMYTEQEFLSNGIEEKVAMTMLRNLQSMKKLQDFESKGCLAINSAFGIENCTREKMTRLLMEHEVPHPKSYIMNTHDDVSDYIPEGESFMPCWVKRGDFHAIHREDVSYVRTREELIGLLSE